jgi:hypothetical protein
MLNLATGNTAGDGEEIMKFSLFAAAAFVAAMAFSGPITVSTPVYAQNKAACQHHLQGYTRTTGPAQEAMKKNYAACLKKKK